MRFITKMLKIKYCRNVSVKADLQTGTQRIGLVTGQVGGEDRWVVTGEGRWVVRTGGW